jgi:tetratricopeptide (TPR) repeat protein
MRFGVSADASNVGPDSLGLLKAEVGRLAAAYPQQPLPMLIGDVVSLQDQIFTLLEGRQRPRETRDLYIIGGLASGMLAKAAHDFGDPYTAMTHARTAMLCAKNAEHSALIAWVCGLQSLITYWADRPRDALQYAQVGMDLSDSHGTARVWLASLEARAWSALGNATESQRAIERAIEMREHLTASDLDELGGICNFSRARQLYYAADAGASLVGSHADASSQRTLYGKTESYALEAITAYESAPSGEKSFGDEAGARTDLAIARARVGSLDGALEAVQPVLDMPASQRIRGVIGSVVNVHRTITATSPDAPIAREIQEAIEDYCRTPVAALPS